MNTIEERAKSAVRFMWRENQKKENDRSLFAVKDLIGWGIAFGSMPEETKKLYDYILKNEPYGCYVSGDKTADWRQDWFVLPNEIPEEKPEDALKDGYQILIEFYEEVLENTPEEQKRDRELITEFIDNLKSVRGVYHE